MSFQYYFSRGVDQPSPQAFLEGLKRFDDIRPYCAKSLRDGVEPVHSITVPGGLYHADTVDYPCAPMSNWDFHDQGYEDHADTRRVLRFVQYLLRSGVPVDPNFTVHHSNFLHGEDYLATDYKSDAVLVGFVLNNECDRSIAREPWTYDPNDKVQKAIIEMFKADMQRGQFQHAAHSATELAAVVSPHASLARWKERLSSAKIIASIHRVDEIHLDRLGLESHNVVLSHLPIARLRLGADIEGSGPPRDQWELAFERGYEASLRPHLSQNTLLGRALATTTPPMAEQQSAAGRPSGMQRFMSRFRPGTSQP
jgi:hypothetical protein